MKISKPLLILGVVVLIVAVLGIAYYLGVQKNAQVVTPTPTPLVSTSPTPSPSPTAKPKATPTSTPQTSIPAGWKTYRNEKYGFEISAPADYQTLDDKDSLSGYPNGVVLIYNGGQAYDVIIEVWKTKAEYEAAYAGRMSDLTVKLIRERYITVFNNTKEGQNSGIIATFKAL